MIGKMAIAAASPGYNDLGRSVTPSFLSRNRFYSQLSPHCPKLKKFKISVHGISNPAMVWLQGRVKLWSLNTNLFFNEPHQLTNFT